MFRKHKAAKIIGLILIVYFLITIVPQLLTTCGRRGSAEPPPITKAPYLVTTASRIYYAENALKQGASSVIMENYYSLRNGRWVLVKGKQDLPFDLFGNVKIVRRTPTPTPRR